MQKYLFRNIAINAIFNLNTFCIVIYVLFFNKIKHFLWLSLIRILDVLRHDGKSRRDINLLVAHAAHVFKKHNARSATLINDHPAFRGAAVESGGNCLSRVLRVCEQTAGVAQSPRALIKNDRRECTTRQQHIVLSSCRKFIIRKGEKQHGKNTHNKKLKFIDIECQIDSRN